MKKYFFFGFTIMALSATAWAGDCEKAEKLKFINEGKSLAELISQAGKPDLSDYYCDRQACFDLYSYFPVCSNQTIYNFSVRHGQVVSVDKKIQR